MSNVMYPAEILKRTTALAETDQNLEMMDCVAVLHGYVELCAFRPDDPSRQKEVDDAIGRLLKAAARYPRWNQTLSDISRESLCSEVIRR